MAASKLSRFQGSMVGAVVGDCIGSEFEGLWGLFIGIEKVLKEVEKIEADPTSQQVNKNGEKSAKKTETFWIFTDDTAMARSVAKSLIQHNGLDTTDIAKRFTSEFFRERDRGYGGSVSMVFDHLQENDCSDVFGPAQRQFDGEGSYGNGGAMRIGPAGLFTAKKNMNFDQIKDLTEQITRITHSHKDAILGAILQCYAVNIASQTEKLDVDIFIDSLLDKIRPLEEEFNKKIPQKKMEESESDTTDSDEVPATYCYKLELVRRFAKQDTIPSNDEVGEKLGVFIAALDSVPAAIYCVLRALKDIEGIPGRSAFERTIIYAISLGGDTDTVATMAGAIAGAYYGLDSIPTPWQLECEGVKDAKIDAELMCNLE